MSLINDMLHDLEKRRKQEARQMPVIGTMMVGQTGMTGGKILFVAAAVVLLAGLVWAGFSLLPPMSAEQTPVRKPSAEQVASPTPAEQQRMITISPMTVQGKHDFASPPLAKAADFSTPAAGTVHSVLPKMRLKKEDGAARLFLTFTRPPQYSLVQSGRDNVPLIVSFNETTMGEGLEIPEVTGSVLERISFQPRQAQLLLLVDLADGTRLESLELAKNSEMEHSLVMDFIQEIQLPKPTEGQHPDPVAPEKISDAAKGPQMAPDDPGEGNVGNVARQREQKEIVLTKKKHLPSRDIQAYQTGLEQLHSGGLQAAAKSFSRALAINPAHPKARLQLIATLQQLKQPELAARQMRQGLELQPENRALRKEYARYLLNNNQYDKAIELLRQSPVPSVAGDVEYHALLAALLQESGQFSASANIYARLLRIRPKNGIWWLGLAVSMDQSGNFEQAHNAYQRALNLSELDSGTREYIKSRLEVL